MVTVLSSMLPLAVTTPVTPSTVPIVLAVPTMLPLMVETASSSILLEPSETAPRAVTATSFSVSPAPSATSIAPLVLRCSRFVFRVSIAALMVIVPASPSPIRNVSVEIRSSSASVRPSVLALFEPRSIGRFAAAGATATELVATTDPVRVASAAMMTTWLPLTVVSVSLATKLPLLSAFESARKATLPPVVTSAVAASSVMPAPAANVILPLAETTGTAEVIAPFAPAVSVISPELLADTTDSEPEWNSEMPPPAVRLMSPFPPCV